MHALVITLDQLTPMLLVGAAVLVVSVGAVRLSVRSGLPTLLLYLALGLALGSTPGGVEFNDNQLAQVLAYIALILILTEGGLTTEWKEIRPALAPASALATLGVIVSTATMGAFLRFAFDTPWTLAFLIGAVLSSTDAAAVFSVLRGVSLPRRLSGILEAESGLNDPPVVLIVVLLARAALPGHSAGPWWVIVLTIAYELAVATAVGVILGRAGSWFMRRAASPSSGLFSLGILGITFLAYAVGATLHASGFMAVYVSALVIGSRPMPHRPAVRSFAQAMGWFAQIGLFVMLGLLANAEELPGQILPAIVMGLVLTFVARPLSVVVSLAPFRFSWRESAFVSWAGLRGAVPVVLATVPLTLGTPGVAFLFDLVFVLVITFTLVQAPTMPLLARRLGLVEGAKAVELDVESTPLAELGAELLHVDIGPGSKLHGVRIREIRLPLDAQVTLVVRKGKSFVPDADTVFRGGDDVLIVARSTDREQIEDTLRAVSDRGRLPFWNRPDAARTRTPRDGSFTVNVRDAPWDPHNRS